MITGKQWGCPMGPVKRFLYLALIGGITVALTQVAPAADLPRKAPAVAPAPPPAPTWTGCYIGAGGGYGLFAVDHFGTNNLGQQGFPQQTTGGNGWLASVGGGCDYQFSTAGFGNWVVGAFGAYDWMDLSGDHSWQCIGANGCTYNGGLGTTAQAASELKEKWAWYAGVRLGMVVA